MSNTVITNYTDLNGPSTKADSSVVVIVNKDGSLSVDQNLLGTLMGTDGSQSAGISVVRVGHEGRPDDATDSDTDDDKVPHVTLSVDSYYDDTNSIIKYDSGAEMLQSLRIETRENSLLGFQNDHCYTLLTSPDQSTPQRSDSYAGYDEPILEIKQQSPPKSIPRSKKITILEQKIIPKGKKLAEAILVKGNKAAGKAQSKTKIVKETALPNDESSESSSISSSGDSIQDRDSDSDYKETRDKSGSLRKPKAKPRILKHAQTPKGSRLDPRAAARIKSNKNILKQGIKERLQNKSLESQLKEFDQIRPKETIEAESKKETAKATPKVNKKDKKTPAHMNALLSDMTSLFSTPDVIRRVSTDNKTPSGKEALTGNRKLEDDVKTIDPKNRNVVHKTFARQKATKGYDLIPQIDDASLAQILQDTTGMPSASAKQPTITTVSALNSPNLAGPLSPTLDLLAGLHSEEEGLSEDLLMHVAQLVESSENLQEVIDKQVLGKVDPVATKTVTTPFQTQQTASPFMTSPKPAAKTVQPPIEIIRRDGRVITLPPIEAPATRASKRKSQIETSSSSDVVPTPVAPPPPAEPSPPPAPVTPGISKQYINKAKAAPRRLDHPGSEEPTVVDKTSAESQESWNSEDDPYRLWCICRQPHNNRFMICCDGCEDWFHGKCVNITKVMGQQMEERGIEWRCPNCIKAKGLKSSKLLPQKREGGEGLANILRRQSGDKLQPGGTRTSCIVCKKPARPSSIYCGDACILKHAQDSLAVQASPGKHGDKDKPRAESRVIVFERKTGRCLAGPNAPTAENLKAWLQKNPTFEVVRPGTLAAIKPKAPAKRLAPGEGSKIQTTLNFEKIARKIPAQPLLIKAQQDRESTPKASTSASQPRTPGPPKTQSPAQFYDARPGPSAAPVRPAPSPAPAEVKKPVRAPASRAAAGPQPAMSPAQRRREVQQAPEVKKPPSVEPIRKNVRTALEEHMTQRMKEGTGPRFTDEEVVQFAKDTEAELHELFRDVGIKYKAKYRSLMFNIKDRKNLSLWQKICDKTITPKQLVRLSPEELASQELAQWRDKEAKHQLELIKKSELDLLAASKTYVLKTHKGEEVMETKTSVSTELDPNIAVEDMVTALNDSTVGDDSSAADTSLDTGTSVRKMSADSGDAFKSSRKRDRPDSDAHPKKSKVSKHDDNRRASRSSRKRSGSKTRDDRPRRSERSSRIRSPSKERSKPKEKESKERSSRRSSSRGKSRRRSKSRSKSAARERSASRDRKRRSPRETRSKQRRSTNSAEGKVAHRSRSQDNIKSKNDSTDSDSLERPKSAMMKEAHPEYDPHEPMITSAFSDEELRKSREDIYDAEVMEYGNAEFDASKSFTIDTDIELPKYPSIREKASEAESDQEPSSTVDTSAATVWNGCINMVDVARFYVAAHEVSGLCSDLEEDLCAELDIVGRINPATVWEYIGKMRRSGTKDIVLLRLQAANDEERMQYIALYSYLSTRNRLGVVKVNNTTTVKDLYIVPLASSAPLPAVLLPLDGPGLDEARGHLLIAIVIRQRRKRPAPAAAAVSPAEDVVPAKVTRVLRKRSYTPPPPPAAPAPPAAYTSPALPSSVKDKIAATLASARDSDEAYSPGSPGSGSPGSGSAGSGGAAPALRSKMEELNRQIEEQKQQIMKMARADSSVNEEDEAYSPSRPMTPPPPAAASSMADIALPSNLQEILATIKQRSVAARDTDLRKHN